MQKKYLVIIVVFSSSIANALPCLNKDSSGSWNYGTVPAACNVSPIQKQSSVKQQYNPVIFNDVHALLGARDLYMQSMYTFVREMGKYYIKRRNPNVGPAEMDGFLLGLTTLAAQESYYTHYRRGADGIIRAMRGDNLHGYGLMQIDDRSHASTINKGGGTDLAWNLLLGLDLYYTLWVKSAKASCVSSNTDWKARARSAWAAYNGGPKNICRWTNTKSKWAKNDKGYLLKYNNRKWLSHVREPHADSPLDAKCMAEGRRPCAISQEFVAQE